MITLIVPTRNRPDFLKRLLSYYARVKFPHSIVIGDASDLKGLQENKSLVHEFAKTLRVEHCHHEGFSIARSVEDLNRNIQTPFVALLGDDDFLLLEGIEKCIQFLESHPNHAAAHGKGFLFLLNKSGSLGKIKALSGYPQPQVTDLKASHRLLKYLDQYAVGLFSVHRKEVWQNMWKGTSGIEDTAFSAEILPCCLSVVSGRNAELNCPYLLRQGHDRRFLLPDPFDWISDPKWPCGFQIFSKRLEDEIAKKDGVTLAAAREVVKEAFWGYLNSGLIKKYNDRYQKKARKRPPVGRWLSRPRTFSTHSGFLKDISRILEAK